MFKDKEREVDFIIGSEWCYTVFSYLLWGRGGVGLDLLSLPQFLQ